MKGHGHEVRSFLAANLTVLALLLVVLVTTVWLAK